MVGRNENNPEIFAALVHACRYCGQLDASIAAHERAFRLDRNFQTSVSHTYLALGDYEKALYWYGTMAGVYLDALALASMGRLQEASALLWTRRERTGLQPALINSLKYSRTHSRRSKPEKTRRLVRFLMPAANRFSIGVQGCFPGCASPQGRDVILTCDRLTRSSRTPRAACLFLPRDSS